MIEKVRKVDNPLTIVAIFAALAEVSGTGALVAVGDSSRQIVVWFVILFPIFLVTLFFITLNFNPKVLYSPGDFKNESYFVDLIKNTRFATADLSNLEAFFEKSRTEMVALISNIKVENLSEKAAILEKIDQSFKAAAGNVSIQREKLESTIRRKPSRTICPKCGQMMGINEDGNDECNCGHIIPYDNAWWLMAKEIEEANAGDQKDHSAD